MLHCSAMFSLLGKTSWKARTEAERHKDINMPCTISGAIGLKLARSSGFHYFVINPISFSVLLAAAVEMWLFAFLGTETFLQSAGSGEVCKVCT